MKIQKPEKINRISDSALTEKTGKTWQDWFKILNSAGAQHLSHQEIVRYLSDKRQVDDWWAQMITVGYEQYHGKRERHQKPDGYEISVSKTINATVTAVYDAWIVEKLRQKWLSESITIRKATSNKSIRLTWIDEVTNVVVNFYEKGANKSQVVVQHSKISDSKAAEEKKIFWKNAIAKLCESLGLNHYPS